MILGNFVPSSAGNFPFPGALRSARHSCTGAGAQAYPVGYRAGDARSQRQESVLSLEAVALAASPGAQTRRLSVPTAAYRLHGQGNPIADHIVERRDGGSDDSANLRSVCATCHNKRHPSTSRSAKPRYRPVSSPPEAPKPGGGARPGVAHPPPPNSAPLSLSHWPGSRPV
jgi:hypothetical protein